MIFRWYPIIFPSNPTTFPLYPITCPLHPITSPLSSFVHGYCVLLRVLTPWNIHPFIVGCILVYFRSSFTSAFNWRPTLPTFNPLYFHFLMVDMLICWWLISEGLASAGRSCSCFRIEYSRVWNHALFETFTWSRGPWALNDICTRP